MSGPRGKSVEHLALGLAGEELAAAFLIEKGMRIVDRRYRCRRGELDIVARCGKEWIFVEVKTRVGSSMGTAVEAMTRRKAERMTRAIREYVYLHRLEREPIRCDMVAVDYGDDGVPTIQHFPASIPMI